MYKRQLFKQVFKDNLQTAEKDAWLEKQSWLTKTDTSFDVYFGKKKVTSRLYDIDVIGYDSGVNKLRLFDLESVDESLVKDGITFDKEDVEKNLTLFLYPDDSDEAGNLLRIYQQYFMVSLSLIHISGKSNRRYGHRAGNLSAGAGNHHYVTGQGL